MVLPNHTYSATASRVVQARTTAGHETTAAAEIVLGINPKVYQTHEQERARVKPDQLRR